MGDHGLRRQGRLGRRPGADQGRQARRGDHTFSDAKNVGLYTACENNGTAWDFLKFTTSEEQDGKWLNTTGQMPLRQDLVTTYPDYFAENPAYTQFADQAGRVVEVPNVANSTEIWQDVPRHVDQGRDLRRG